MSSASSPRFRRTTARVSTIVDQFTQPPPILARIIDQSSAQPYRAPDVVRDASSRTFGLVIPLLGTMSFLATTPLWPRPRPPLRVSNPPTECRPTGQQQKDGRGASRPERVSDASRGARLSMRAAERVSRMRPGVRSGTASPTKLRGRLFRPGLDGSGLWRG